MWIYYVSFTDRGTEYCGGREHHEYQLHLNIEDIDHTKAKSPQTNGICERFHRTMQDEFYAIAFRKKLYNTLEELQSDLDQWVEFYNTERPHSGRYCYGKTPLQTFADSKDLAQDKNLNNFFQQNAIFKPSDQTEAGSAEEPPAKGSLTDGNEKEAEKTTASSSKSFLSQMP